MQAHVDARLVTRAAPREPSPRAVGPDPQTAVVSDERDDRDHEAQSLERYDDVDAGVPYDCEQVAQAA
jgi:hypothetical protein